MTSARRATVGIRADLIREGLHGSGKVSLQALRPSLRDLMVVQYLTAYKRVLTTQKPLQLSLVNDGIEVMRKALHLSHHVIEQVAGNFDKVAYTLLETAGTFATGSVQATILDLIAEGVTSHDAIEALSDKMDALGITPQKDYQLETLYRTATSISVGAGSWNAYQDPDIAELLWGFRYSGVDDDRERVNHRAANNVTLPKSDSFWSYMWPPNGYNCRCQPIPLYDETAEIHPPKDGSAHPDPGWGFNVGALFSALPKNQEIALAHDVSLEKRNEKGRWTKIGSEGANLGETHQARMYTLQKLFPNFSHKNWLILASLNHNPPPGKFYVPHTFAKTTTKTVQEAFPQLTVETVKLIPYMKAHPTSNNARMQTIAKHDADFKAAKNAAAKKHNDKKKGVVSKPTVNPADQYDPKPVTKEVHKGFVHSLPTVQGKLVMALSDLNISMSPEGEAKLALKIWTAQDTGKTVLVNEGVPHVLAGGVQNPDYMLKPTREKLKEAFKPIGVDISIMNKLPVATSTSPYVYKPSAPLTEAQLAVMKAADEKKKKTNEENALKVLAKNAGEKAWDEKYGKEKGPSFPNITGDKFPDKLYESKWKTWEVSPECDKGKSGISQYKDGMYHSIQKAEAEMYDNPDAKPEHHIIAKRMNDALKAGPAYPGEVWRGFQMSKGDKSYPDFTNVGGTIHFKMSQSASRSNSVAAGFASGKLVMHYVKHDRGVDVRDLPGDHASEYEVLMRGGGTFKILAVHHNVTVAGKKCHTYVDVEEVPASYAAKEVIEPEEEEDVKLAHDVTDEKRDTKGKWSKTGGGDDVAKKFALYNAAVAIGNAMPLTLEQFMSMPDPFTELLPDGSKQTDKSKAIYDAAVDAYRATQKAPKKLKTPKDSVPLDISEQYTSVPYKHQHKQWLNSISDNESEALQDWSGANNSGIQRAEMNDPQAVPMDKVYAIKLNRVLDRAPVYTGQVWRGIRIKENDPNREKFLQVGGTIDFNMSQSTSRSPETAYVFADENMVLNFAKQNRAVDISEDDETVAAEEGTEYEAIMKKGGTFKITKVEHDKKCGPHTVRDYITLEEVPSTKPVKETFATASVKQVPQKVGGTTGAKVVEVMDKKYVMKAYSGRTEQAKNEYLANALYNFFGDKAGAPNSKLKDGTVFNPFVSDLTLLKDVPKEKRDEVYTRLGENFILDAWLANWDVVGTGKDNAAISKVDNSLHRLDNGGALLFRAQGSPKGAAFGPNVTELETMRDSKMSPDASQVFKHLTAADIKHQINELDHQYDKDELKEVVASAGFDAATSRKLVNTLDARMTFLKGFAERT